MRYTRYKSPLVVTLVAVLVLLLLVSSTLIALAQTGGGYDLSWYTIDGGGSATGGGYTLTGAIGQPDAASASGGGYSLTGGFWVGGSSASNNTKYIYLPLVLK